MGEIETYNNLTLSEKHQYWTKYLSSLIEFVSTDKPVKGRAKILEEIERIQKVVDIFQGSSIPKKGIESAINLTANYKRIVKKTTPKSESKLPTIKLPKAQKHGSKMVFRYRYDAQLGGFTAMEDEDRSEEA